MTQEAILSFWFEEIEKAAWFKKDDAFVDQLRARFGALLDEAASGGLESWEESADGRLALILVLDQFSRNLYRGDARSFAQDSRARSIARRAVAEGDHVEAGVDRACFLFLPFEHSEEKADQLWSVALFEALGDENYLNYAVAHLKIVERFGRFPHRNEVLGRTSIAEEIEFLTQPGSSF